MGNDKVDDKIAFDYFAGSQYGGNAGGMNNVNIALCGDPKSGTGLSRYGNDEPNDKYSEERHEAVKHAIEILKGHVKKPEAKKPGRG